MQGALLNKSKVLLIALRAAVVVALIGAAAWICLGAFSPEWLAAMFRMR